MCTAIAYKGKDLLYGFNLDIDPAVWKFSLHKSKSVFAIGITVGKTTYYVHGIHKNGQFGNVPYMNGECVPAPKGMKRERIDLLNDRYVRGRYSFADVEEILKTKAIVCIPEAAMHSLIGNGDGDFLIVEPGCGYEKVKNRFAVLTNFPVFAGLTDLSNPFYGKERYDHAMKTLQNADVNFSASDALRLLYETRQEGQWGTRISFVYSQNENAVYYFLNGDISDVRIHKFG